MTWGEDTGETKGLSIVANGKSPTRTISSSVRKET